MTTVGIGRNPLTLKKISIQNDLVPKFKSYGITDEELQTMMVDNPQRLFPFQYKAKGDDYHSDI